MSRDIEGEGLVENRIQAALHHNRLLLFYTPVLVHEPHLHVGICKANAKRMFTWERPQRCPWIAIFGVRFAITLSLLEVGRGSREAETSFELKVNIFPELENIQMRKYLWKWGLGFVLKVLKQELYLVILSATAPRTARDLHFPKRSVQRTFWRKKGILSKLENNSLLKCILTGRLQILIDMYNRGQQRETWWNVTLLLQRCTEDSYYPLHRQ